jgi:hypothetical protein
LRNVLWTVGLLGTVVMGTATMAAAQTGGFNPYNSSTPTTPTTPTTSNTPTTTTTPSTPTTTTGSYNPYNQTNVNPWCALNPYDVTQVNCLDTRARGTGTVVSPTLYKFGEGVVHAPGSELAWVILTNFDSVSQTVVVELLVSGRNSLITRSITLGPKERKDLSLHDLPEFADGNIATFSTGVYFPLSTGHASLVLRPLTDTFSHVTLPPATVSSGSEQ